MIKAQMRSAKIKTVLALVLALLLTSCFGSQTGSGNIAPGEIADRSTPDEYKIATFEDGYPNGFWARNDRGNGDPFNCSFMRSHATVENGTLTLLLSKENSGHAGAEFRSEATFSYGYYSVCMKAAKRDGVISSFFTYTGWPWDEIDIEFLGNNTTIVQFNYYTNGVGGHEYFYELGFDASEDFHEYGFDWQPDSITWYVDGVAVYRAEQNIPSHSGRIMMNIWNVADSHKEWAGKFDENGPPAQAEYKWIGYQSAE